MLRPLLPKNNFKVLLTAAAMPVGGQAVIEGVMMRSPKSMAVAVRRASKKIVIKEFQWVSIADKYPIFKKPVFRGMTMLVEAMMNGIQALSFSAEQASLDEKVTELAKAAESEVLSKTAIALSVATALGLGLVMFVVVPHLLTDFLGRIWFHSMAVNTFRFHLIDGFIKTAIFISYILMISRLPDIKRVFQYHGAEHKSIFTFENHHELTVPNARRESRFHPRCGTSFILTLILVSIFVFSALFPLLPRPSWHPIVTSLVYALIKVPIMLPVVGFSYEFIRLMGSNNCPTWLKWLARPGMVMQNLTTRDPDDEQLEVGLASLKACLWREDHLNEKPTKREALIELDNISSPVFEEKLATTL